MNERTLPNVAATLESPTSPRDTVRADPAFAVTIAASASSTPPPASAELPLVSVGARDGSDGSDLSVVRTLGEGGMGRVYLAAQHSLRRDVALKTCHDGEGSAEALVQEGVLTGMLEHPNIPPIHALGRDAAGMPVLVMKRIEGVSWADALAEGKRDLVANLEILIQLCNALQFAHERGVIHRDVKPSNVMLGRYGEVYLIDWGVAFHRAWHVAENVRLVGSPAYLAPEMAACGTPDARTDVYLLGATLHEVLTGKPPHDATSTSEALKLALASKPIAYPDDVPAELAALCSRAMSRDPDARPTSAAEFQAALRSYLAHRGASALTSAARSRLDELRTALANGADESACARLASECRFGFHQALREWPENVEARAGLRETLVLLADRELERDDYEGAAALLAEMPGDDPELRARIDEVRVRIQRDEAVEKEMDMRVAQRERILLTLTGVLLGGGLLWRRWQSPPQSLFGYDAQWTMVRVAVGMLLLFAVLFAIAGRRMLQNAFNRRWAALVLVSLCAILLHRVLLLRFVPGAPVTALADLLIVAIALGTAALYVTARLAWPALIFASGAVLVSLFPAYTPPITNLTLVLAATAAALAVRATARRTGGGRRRTRGSVTGQTREDRR